MDFKAEIHLGNDAMRTGNDVAAALRKIADQLDLMYGTDEPNRRLRSVRVMDLNGAEVGTWTVE